MPQAKSLPFIENGIMFPALKPEANFDSATLTIQDERALEECARGGAQGQ